MYLPIALVAASLPFFVWANPIPGSENAPITDAQWQALKEGGLRARGSSPRVNQPISDAEWQSLESGGLSKRQNSPTELFRRDKVMNCGHLITGSGGSGGHGKWVPVQQFANLADKFCNDYVGTDIYKGHSTSDTYGCTLTNQDDDTKPGPSGNIVFAIYNTDHDGTWVVDHDTCLRAMQAPLGGHSKDPQHDELRARSLSKRDNCYGKKHGDYEGGYYKIDGIGAFGSEVYAAN